MDCAADPAASLEELFVNLVQKGRINRGQCPALRPVFHKPHGIAHGTFRIKDDLPAAHRVGVFSGKQYPLWMRFSSDTSPTSSDYKSTIGVGIKLFDVPGKKIIGAEDDNTFDFIMQNMDVFFVDTAKDMCEFTKAALIDRNIDEYLKEHPITQEILDAMKKPVGSVLASPYWSIMPFAFGSDRFVKYKLEPLIDDTPPTHAPNNPYYLGADLQQRLKETSATFKFCVQFRTDDATMPLDAATVPWKEDESPFVHIADIELPQQDIASRSQPDYGENLAWNIWRVTEEHQPQGSIADARRRVYASSAKTRHDANGIANGEPMSQKNTESFAACEDDVIVRAAIHPGIGVARVGDAQHDFFIGPEVTHPVAHSAGFYRDAGEGLKRQAAKYRIYGYNAAGKVVRELTANNADITWEVELANRKASWYQFITAMDIPETADLSVPRRNPKVATPNRDTLAITPGKRSIAGTSQSGLPEYAFSNGKFKDVKDIYLGELQTDDSGRLIVLGGRGVSKSPSGAPPFDPADPSSFNNADDWYDDMSDGPVHATVSIDNKSIPVDSAWAVVTPPNYAPDAIGWRTLYDLLVDVYVNAGWLPVPKVTSFTQDVLPQLARLSNLQWVNKGFATMFGKGGPMDFDNPTFVQRLSTAPTSGQSDTWAELRRQVLNAFRPHNPENNEPRIWPWLYGDSFDGELFNESPRTMLDLPSIQELHLKRWAKGDFINDWKPDHQVPNNLDAVPLQEQPAMLDQAALTFCLADAFHPGCEMTWPMRHASMYEKPFRLRQRPDNEAAPDYGSSLSAKVALSPEGPLHEQSAGDISRWMGLPWQGDTAYCRSGYDVTYDAYLPAFWPARVPNQVLTEEDYAIVMDTTRPREERLAAYNRRASWYRFIDDKNDVPPVVPKRMERMIAMFGAQGIVEQRQGIANDDDFPSVIYVETVPESQLKTMIAATTLATPTEKMDEHDRQMVDSVWGDKAHLEEALAMRRRR